jgi:hypothetical protein
MSTGGFYPASQRLVCYTYVFCRSAHWQLLVDHQYYRFSSKCVVISTTTVVISHRFLQPKYVIRDRLTVN